MYSEIMILSAEKIDEIINYSMTEVLKVYPNFVFSQTVTEQVYFSIEVNKEYWQNRSLGRTLEELISKVNEVKEIFLNSLEEVHRRSDDPEYCLWHGCEIDGVEKKAMDVFSRLVIIYIQNVILERLDGQRIKSAKKNKKPRFAFKLKEEISCEKLYQKMKGHLIDKKTTYNQFENAFNGKAFIHEPISWIGGPGLLAYFIKEITVKRIVENEYEEWSRAKIAFTKSNNLANNYQSYLKNKSERPRGFKKVDNVLKPFIPL